MYNKCLCCCLYESITTVMKLHDCDKKIFFALLIFSIFLFHFNYVNYLQYINRHFIHLRSLNAVIDCLCFFLYHPMETYFEFIL